MREAAREAGEISKWGVRGREGEVECEGEGDGEVRGECESMYNATRTAHHE